MITRPRYKAPPAPFQPGDRIKNLEAPQVSLTVREDTAITHAHIQFREMAKALPAWQFRLLLASPRFFCLRKITDPNFAIARYDRPKRLYKRGFKIFELLGSQGCKSEVKSSQP